MKIENVIKKFSSKDIYLCPKCCNEAVIDGFSIVCENKHRYDFSKKGYIHLINNYKSTKYSVELFEARSVIFRNEFYKDVLKELGGIIGRYAKDIIVDIGCGEGYYIRELKKVFPQKYFYGLDNSKDAVNVAVKDDKLNPYMVADLTSLPLKDSSVSCVLNILTPANYDEFFRVLEDEGVLIKIIPNSSYLKEIREITGARDYTNEDTIRLVEENCIIVERQRVNKTYKLDENFAVNFLKMTPLTFSKDILKEDIKKFREVTVDLEILVCQKNNKLIN